MDANNPYYVVVADKSSQLLLLAIHVYMLSFMHQLWNIFF